MDSGTLRSRETTQLDDRGSQSDSARSVKFELERAQEQEIPASTCKPFLLHMHLPMPP